MEVVGNSFGFRNEQRLHAFSADRDYVVLILQDAFYREKSLAGE